MGSRIFWILMVVVALFAGAATQPRNWLFSWGEESRSERAIEAAAEARAERSIESRFDRMQVVGSNGERIDVSPETRRELGHAVRRLVAAESELALARIGDEGDVKEARSRRDAARAEVERLKEEIDTRDELSERDRDLVRQQIRENIRETVRTAVGN